MKNSCIVNMTFKDKRFGSDWYGRGQARLLEQMRRFTESDYFFFNSESEVGAPPHTSYPYAFKVHAVRAAIDEGYRFILWADASMFPVKPIQKVWDIIQDKGYFFVKNGFNAGEWTSDSCLESLGMSRYDSFKVDSIYGGIYGLDMQNEKTNEFFSRLWRLTQDGALNGCWESNEGFISNDSRVKGHRHDQSAMSILAHQMGMTDYTDGLVQEWGWNPEPIKEDTIFVCWRTCL